MKFKRKQREAFTLCELKSGTVISFECSKSITELFMVLKRRKGKRNSIEKTDVVNISTGEIISQVDEAEVYIVEGTFVEDHVESS